MGKLSITSLKLEYQEMVLKNQKKYNPDFDDKLVDSEIRVLMQDANIKTVEELSSVPQGYQIEKPSNSNNVEAEKRILEAQKKVRNMENNKRVDALNKEINQIQKEIDKNKKRMAVLQSDYNNGSANGVDSFKLNKTLNG